MQSAQQLSCSTVSSQLRDQTDCFRPGQFKVYSSAVRGTLIMDTVSSISLSLKMQYFQKSYFTSAVQQLAGHSDQKVSTKLVRGKRYHSQARVIEMKIKQ